MFFFIFSKVYWCSNGLIYNPDCSDIPRFLAWIKRKAGNTFAKNAETIVPENYLNVK
jgi:hypothetical protein